MDAFDLFRRLGAGASFDLKKFGKDAERFKLVKSKKSERTDSSSGVPDFFSTDSSSGTAVRSGDEHDSDSEPETEGSPPAGIRKRGAEESGKNQTPGIGDSETQESDGILWTSSLDKKAKGPSGKSQNPSWKRLKHLHQEKVNGIRHKHKIYTHGSDLPDPVTSFEQLQEEYKIHPRIIHNIKEAGFQGPTPIQMQAIPVMLHSREVLACAPTGSGKTVAFCLPILCHLKQPMNKGFRALVLSPTRELASQTHRELVKLSDGVGFRVHMIHKGAEAAKKFGPKSSKKYGESDPGERVSREVLACAPTGSGKTVAFCLPILCHLKQPMNKGFRALVLSPTRELASQTHRELVKLSDGVGFRVHMIHKGAEAAKKFGPKSSKKYGEGFADFKSAGGDDGFTDFKTADSISPLDPPEQAKIFQQTFPPPFLQTQPLQQQPQPHNSTATLPPPKPPLNMADLDLFSSLGGPAASTTAETKALSFPAPSTLASSLPPLAAPSSGAGRKALSGADDFGDFALFGSSSLGVSVPSAGAAHIQDNFADFMVFGSASSSGVPEQKTAEEKPSENNSSVGETPLQQQQQKSSDKYDIFKRLSLEGSTTPLGFEDAKESLSAGLASASSVVKGDADDFADFHSSRFSSALGASEKSLVDKVAAFKQAKEDSASVKSLDLPSIGGSSAGKEDSEDALSVQLDMKLSDLGGELQHVLSDSSLDLPVVSGHQPPAAGSRFIAFAEVDDFKFDPFGTFSACDSAVSSLASFDWSEREEPATNQSKKPQPSFFTSEGSPASATSVLQKKETSFGSEENVAVTTSGKVSAFTSEEASSASTAEGQCDTFADFGTKGQGEEEEEEEDDFGDFASTVSEKSDTAPVSGDPGSDTTQPDDFGASQADKPKFGKFDFLMASSQAKVKSSEEMIRSELATFDLSVQGSHKRSLSLGDKEISHSTPSPAPEQPFRDKSNTLSEKPALPVIRDKYKDLTGEVEESERYAYEWQRCLESALQVSECVSVHPAMILKMIIIDRIISVINKANDTLNGISSSSVCTEVIQSAQGMEYLLGVVEVYRVVRRVELGIKATAVCSDKLQQLLKDINRVWHNLIGFMSLANLSPDESSLDFSSCILRHGIKNAKELACGVCLLSVDSRSKAFSSETDSFKLMYGGHQYHASCANFWINCVEPKPPGLILPDLL
ncbi:UNVERIFIED_CONTAM: hypothetical protein FKN15_076188 [Acipenser sinensis]